jgi:hypothetical protein
MKKKEEILFKNSSISVQWTDDEMFHSESDVLKAMDEYAEYAAEQLFEKIGKNMWMDWDDFKEWWGKFKAKEESKNG